jgi:hypothetical protein
VSLNEAKIRATGDPSQRYSPTAPSWTDPRTRARPRGPGVQARRSRWLRGRPSSLEAWLHDLGSTREDPSRKTWRVGEGDRSSVVVRFPDRNRFQVKKGIVVVFRPKCALRVFEGTGSSLGIAQCQTTRHARGKSALRSPNEATLFAVQRDISAVSNCKMRCSAESKVDDGTMNLFSNPSTGLGGARPRNLLS